MDYRQLSQRVFLCAAVLIVAGCKKVVDTGSNNNAPPATCGNGQIDPAEGETCDATLLGGNDCTTVGAFSGGTLACAANCQFDTSGCQGANCGNGVADPGEVCDGADLAGLDCQTLGFETGQLACAADCRFDVSDCSTCGNLVAEGQEACDAGDFGASTCVTEGFDGGSLGCNPDCTVDTSTCLTQGTGTGCNDAFIITTFPHNVSGADFSVDATDTEDWSGATGCAGAGPDPEMVFAIDLQAGETISMHEPGGLVERFRVLDQCDPAVATCLFDSQFGQADQQHLFQAPADGTYWVVVEEIVQGGALDYDLTIDLVPPEDCGDAADNDLDTLVDCEDPDCFGDPIDCATEALCGDGQDNDADGDADCLDVDCFGLGPCTIELDCGDGQDNDADGDTDCADSECLFDPACGGGFTAHTVTNLGLAIPLSIAGNPVGYDGTLASMACTMITVPATGTDTVVAAALDLAADHAWVGDLVIKLVSPMGTVLTLLSRPGVAEAADDGAPGAGFGNGAGLAVASPIQFVNIGPFDAEQMGVTLVNGEVVCTDDGECNFSPNPGAGPGTDFDDFNGESAVGDWQVCFGDTFPAQDDGTVQEISLLLVTN